MVVSRVEEEDEEVVECVGEVLDCVRVDHDHLASGGCRTSCCRRADTNNENRQHSYTPNIF